MEGTSDTLDHAHASPQALSSSSTGAVQTYRRGGPKGLVTSEKMLHAMAGAIREVYRIRAEYSMMPSILSIVKGGAPKARISARLRSSLASFEPIGKMHPFLDISTVISPLRDLVTSEEKRRESDPRPLALIAQAADIINQLHLLPKTPIDPVVQAARDRFHEVLVALKANFHLCADMVKQYYATAPIIKMIQASSWQRRFETLALTLSGLSDALHTAIACAHIPSTIEISGFGKLDDVLALLRQRTKPEHSMIDRRVKPGAENLRSAEADPGPGPLVSKSTLGEAKRGAGRGPGGAMHPDADVYGEPSNGPTPVEAMLDHHLSEHHPTEYMVVTYENMDLTEGQLAPLTALLQKCIDTCVLDNEVAGMRMKLLQDVCTQFLQFPSSYWTTDVKLGNRIAAGAEATVFEGKHAGRDVVIRVFHPLRTEGWGTAIGPSVGELVAREAVAHWQLRHKNIVPFVGLFQSGEEAPAMVLLRAKYDSADAYLRVRTDPDEFLKIVRGIADGLAYLHSRSPPVIHGDLHPNNLLVREDGVVQICDFGLSRIRHEVTRTLTTIRTGGRLRYLAPELTFGAEAFRITESGDVYSFAMVIYTLGTRSLPFANLPNEWTAADSARRGERPGKPTPLWLGGLDDQTAHWLWSAMTKMWDADPEQRPTMTMIQANLAGEVKPIAHSPSMTVAAPTASVPSEARSPSSASRDSVLQTMEPLCYARAHHSWTGTEDDDMNLEVGDRIAVLETREDGWWVGKQVNEARHVPGRSVFPSNFVTLIRGSK